MANLIAQARAASSLSQDELAGLSGTSRPTLSAYENGRKSPSLSTATRIVEASGFELRLAPTITFRQVTTSRNRVLTVPDRLWRLAVEQALAEVTLPLHLNWSAPGQVFNLRDRNRRARVYEVVLREGMPKDLLTYVDGVLLVDLWDDLVLPRELREAWNPVIERPLETDIHLAS
ncbi:helix-turn-helix transcriptional regulator [Kineosporia rhizophila]|uniref:helix-turn-helix transcriptional regulator n=1 Tax=Kineosporia TaxID=49184 RepID=UPI000AF66310|nr:MULTISPECIES: helix-turn-helix transcriptional regulator [Kineosporia]MCE0533912.1 helix-turn-helix transcriptional regulator [Kineosporia rhizophila]GLY13451.1 hypothetical protein Kisp01_04670 [Kineosporia sp. NBRC 101677]